MFFNSVASGVAVSFGVVMVIGVADGLSTYVLNGATISSKERS